MWAHSWTWVQRRAALAQHSGSESISKNAEFLSELQPSIKLAYDSMKQISYQFDVFWIKRV